MIEAYELLDEATRPRLLAIVKPYEPTERIKNIKGLEIINTSISEQEILGYYQNALALVFVSLHEGFGLPIAEAMACGIPVITSNSTSCKEIADDAALLVDPESIEEIKNTMQQIAENVTLQNELSKKGLVHAKLFNWEKSAEQFYTILIKAVV